MFKPLFTREELAARWYLQPSTLDQWRWTGKGPRFINMGRIILYRIQDIEAFEERKAKKSTSSMNDEEISKSLLEFKLRK